MKSYIDQMKQTEISLEKKLTWSLIMMVWKRSSFQLLASWWFQIFFIFTLTLGDQFDYYFSNGLKPPTSWEIFGVHVSPELEPASSLRPPENARIFFCTENLRGANQTFQTSSHEISGARSCEIPGSVACKHGGVDDITHDGRKSIRISCDGIFLHMFIAYCVNVNPPMLLIFGRVWQNNGVPTKTWVPFSAVVSNTFCDTSLRFIPQ